MPTSRRSFLATSTLAGATWLLADWGRVRPALAHAAWAMAQRPAPPFRVLTPAEAAELAAVAERIMPTTDTPGAREAGVIYFIDQALATFDKAQLPDVKRGIAELRRRAARRNPRATSFAGLAPADQDAILVEMEKGDFFQGMRFATMVGMFADPRYGGNRDAVGWKLLGFDHQPTYAPPFGHYDAEAAGGR